MTTATTTLADFLLARIAEDEAAARACIYPQHGDNWIHDGNGEIDCAGLLISHPTMICHAAHIARHDPARVLAECEAKRRIVELHQSWPVLVETPPTVERVENGVDNFALRASQQIQWLTQREYVERFGIEPPTAPILAALATTYADHPDYREEWRP